MLSSCRRAAAVAILSVATLTSVAAHAAEPATVTGSPQFGAWGFDLAGRDPSVSPGADFFQYANGAYVKALVIPPDRSRYGSFDALAELSDQRVHGLLEAAAANNTATGAEAMIGAFYRAYMDETQVETLGAKPLEGDLAAIRSAKDRAALATLMGRNNTSYFGTVFDVGISGDFKAPDRYAIYLAQAGLGLPSPRLLPAARLRLPEGEVSGLRRPDARGGELAGCERSGQGDRRLRDRHRRGQLVEGRAA